jgi:hypothetical protein
MSEIDQPAPPPENKPAGDHDPSPNPSLKILWLFVAFIPSLVALGLLSSHTFGNPALGWGLVILTAGCCFGAGIGLVRGMRNTVAQALLAIFLTGFFFFANVVIVVLIGCSRMGPIG